LAFVAADFHFNAGHGLPDRHQTPTHRLIAFPRELEPAVRDFVNYYNHRRYHEWLDVCTPADVYYGRHHEVLSERDKIKKLTMQRRKKEYRAAIAA
jgi:transposase InsO family protein